MIRFLRSPALCNSGLALLFILFFSLASALPVSAQNTPPAPSHAFRIDCSSSLAGDGSIAHPWNSLAAAQAHVFSPGDRIALARGTICNGAFAPQGSGVTGNPIRLTAYGQGPRPSIVATPKDRQTLLLFNQEYWQIDSLDLSGSNEFGIFVTGDRGTLHHIALRNLYVHDVQGGAMKHKDNGLVVVGPSKAGVVFEDILVDGVVAAHTNQWAGILIGGGPFYIPPEAPLNRYVIIRNSTVQDVFGDGIVLFRDADSLIETSAAWQTGMQPTETTGTPNAIWTWTCTDCAVRDNEAFLTDSPGVDGGAYDIDWDNTRNIVERNYAHDTQGYCFAVFAAGYVTSESVVRNNLCIDNGLSPRLAALQGAIYLSTWNGGVIHGLRIEHNTIVWNPPVSTAAALVDIADTDAPITFTGNRIDSAAPNLYRANTKFSPFANTYNYSGQARFTLGDQHDVTLETLQSAGVEKNTTLNQPTAPPPPATSLRLEATIDFSLDADGLLAPAPLAQLVVFRNLAAQYAPSGLTVTVHLRTAATSSPEVSTAQANALLDLNAGSIHFDRDAHQPLGLRLIASDGHTIKEWQGFQNAASLGGTVRALLGAPHFAEMRTTPTPEAKQ